MIIVTGGAGFIGSNIVRELNARGRTDILIVDNLKDGRKFKNIADCDFFDYWDQDELLAYVQRDEEFYPAIDAIFHQGACSTTTEWDGRYMMENNYTYSKTLFHYALERRIPFLYASSAAVYGAETTFKEERAYEKPLNVYGFSKIQFDQYVRHFLPQAESQIVGFRYFNVYGPGEAHKDSMASVAFHFYHQLKEKGVIRLFEGCDGYADGEQRRDFIFVQDVTHVNLWFMDHPDQSGIFNLGTGLSRSFNDVARAVLKWHGRGKIEYIPFPEHLKGRYQSFTEADITRLRNAGYDADFTSVEDGVTTYMDELHEG